MAKKSSSTDAEKLTVKYWLAVVVGVCITLFAGTLYGRYSQRWGPPAALVAAGANLELLPIRIGGWQLVEELSINDTTQAMLECAAYVNRQYVNQESGQAVNVAIIVGPPGPTAVHTPEICYSTRAYELVGNRKAVSIETASSESHSFWRTEFKARNSFDLGLRVYYAWSRGRKWVASESPRFEFAGAPLLYKIQLAGPIEPGADDGASDPCRQFLTELMKSQWFFKSS